MDSTFFLDKVIDLLITVIGVAFGSYIALYIAKYQINQQTKQEQRKNDEITRTLINRCKLELRDNKSLLKNQLIPTLELSKKPHESHYEWILTIAASFESAAYKDLLRLNLSHNMPKKIEGGLSSSYEMLEGIHNMIKRALAGFKYQDVYGGIPDFRQTNYDNIKTYSQTVLSHVDYCLKKTAEFIDKE